MRSTAALMRAIVLSSLFLRVLSGKSDPLPGHPPLRTVLASFPAHGSSLDKPLLGASIIAVFWVMDLSMACWTYQY
jgi:hypothetical protein